MDLSCHFTDEHTEAQRGVLLAWALVVSEEQSWSSKPRALLTVAAARAVTEMRGWAVGKSSPAGCSVSSLGAGGEEPLSSPPVPGLLRQLRVFSCLAPCSMLTPAGSLREPGVLDPGFHAWLLWNLCWKVEGNISWSLPNRNHILSFFQSSHLKVQAQVSIFFP